MAQEYELESILVADCGSTTTRVSLIDLVGSEFRLIAGAETATTVEVPWSRISIGIRQAIREIERLTGRVLLGAQEQLIVPERENASGVDGFVATVNAAVPLRVAVVGLIRDLSVESLLRAADSSYVVTQSVVGRGYLAAGGETQSSMQAMLKDVLRDGLDAILLGGGVDGSAIAPVLEAAEDLAAALTTRGAGGRTHVIFAGNKRARPQIAEVLGDCCNLHVVDNVLPTLETEDLRAAEEEMDSLYREYKMGRVPGFGELKAWVSAPVLPTAEGFGLVLRYLAQLYKLDVLGVDIGGTATQVAGVIDGRYGSTVKADLGVAYSMGKILEQAGIDRLLRWLPFDMEAEEAHNRILNKALRPMTVPETKEELLFEQAAAREAAALTLDRARSTWLNRRPSPHPGLMPLVDLIVGRGGVLSQAPQPAQAALILLDAIQPVGVCTLALDKASLLPQLGALALVQSLAAAQVVGRDGFLKLGTVIALAGRGRAGSVALRINMKYDDGQTIKVEVPYGALEIIPLAPGSKAVVELRPSAQFDVGLGRRGKGATTEVDGGVLGIIVDARGRPLSLPDDEKRRSEKIQEWLWEVGL
jgi:uncharacterized protein (TIGR01319 family)